MNTKLSPLCFVLMPFGVKSDSLGRTCDFDRVYSDIILPALRDAGMEAIRADQETIGGIIHKVMFERLILCPFAVADLTMSNPNVFYELGVRHAFRPHTTALLHAEGSQPPFDLAPDRYIKYLIGNDGCPSDAQTTRTLLAEFFGDLKAERNVDSPIYQLVDNLPHPALDHLRTESFRERITRSDQLIRRIRETSHGGVTSDLQELEDEIGEFSETEAGILIELLLAYRDHSAWTDIERVVDAMPVEVSRTALVQEQYALALNRKATEYDSRQAEEVISALIAERGGNSESFAILGRIYKDRWRRSIKSDPNAASGFLRLAIDTYYKGMLQDPRDSYPSINYLTLLFVRAGASSELHELVPVVKFATRRKIELHGDDYWDHATLLELATLEQDKDTAREEHSNSLAFTPAPWQCDTTANNLELIANSGNMEELHLDWCREIISDLRHRASPA